jgi:predicted nucleic acid-binding protein
MPSAENAAPTARIDKVAARPEHVVRIRAGIPQEIVRLARQRAIIVSPLSPVRGRVCRDADDLIVIYTAMAGAVDYLVTLDGDMLDDDRLKQTLAAYGVSVVTPREFFVVLH